MTTMSAAHLPTTLLAVGDLFLRDEDAAPYFAATGSVLAAGDITFGNCEQPYAAKYPKVVPFFKTAAGFDVMSFANNHILDYGNAAFLGTIDLLRDNGIAVSGAGADIAEARKPAVIVANGVTVAFVSFSSIQVPSAQAGPGKPGCAPLKVRTAYHEQFEEYPGTPPQIRTFVDDSDLDALLTDVRRARELADIVAVSLHWGPLLRFSEMSEFQRPTAHAIIDAGADIILGHHPHIMKVIEVYRGKAIFYSMGHFLMRTHAPVDTSYESAGQVSQSMVQRNIRAFRGEFGFHPDYPFYPFALNKDTLKTMIVKADITGGSIGRVSFLPCLIGTDYQPRILEPGDPDFDDLVTFMRHSAKENDIETGLTVDGAEVVVIG
jgi:poly-gamma-glutamate synthesis protein (capsule biosynthesis protein)